jgi:glyoxalase family protein
MVHRVSFRVASEEALSFWVHRLGDEGINSELEGLRLSFSDPEGMGLELAAVETGDEPLAALHPEIPAELALQGFDGVRAFANEPDASRPFLEEALAFEAAGESVWEVRGAERGSSYSFDEPPTERGLSGAGTVHHVAWSSPTDEHEAWRERVAQAGGRPTPVIDRFYFRSIYFREPSGVLFEIATLGPGFTADEPLESLGESLSLPPAYEPLRERLEHVLTPLPDPRPVRTAK